MFNKILVPLDGSDLSEKALVTAVSIARKLNSDLMLMHVIPQRNMPVPEYSEAGYDQFINRFDTKYEDWANNYLNEVKNRYEDISNRISTHVEVGHVAYRLLETSNNVDLIVISTHGYSGLTKWILGSVTERIIGHANCPVLVVKGDQPINKILLPLDGSDYSEVAIEPAIGISNAFGGELTCFHVIEPPNDVPNSLVARLGNVDPNWDRWITDHHDEYARKYFKTLSKTLANEENGEIDMVLRKGVPADSILTYADEEDIDLIVMSTHGRSGIKKWLLGSVAERVIEKLPCHLLIIRPFI